MKRGEKNALKEKWRGNELAEDRGEEGGGEEKKGVAVDVEIIET